MDDNTQYQNQGDGQVQNQKQDQSEEFVSAGSIETGPIPIKQESAPQQVEYGDEVLKQIDQTPEQALEAAERKEIKREDQIKNQPVTAQPVPNPIPKVPANLPKYFGYNISPQITNNTSNIKMNAGKGDPTVSSTWVYMLLDRMLKMRS
jgi:hypothetical protein